jgi:hypothetical protein
VGVAKSLDWSLEAVVATFYGERWDTGEESRR